MTTAAVEAELAIVNVIGAMAIGTAAAESRLLRQGAPVTALATDITVRAVENEAGLRIVIELPLRPVDRVMAQRAILIETACMGVHFAVAVDTVLWRVAKDLRFMAGIAFRLGMRTEQWKPGQAVVEEDVVLPRVLGMTVKTLRSLGALVRVIVLVA